MSMCEFCVTTRNEDGAYFFVYADRFEISKGAFGELLFYRNDDIVSAIDIHLVYKLDRIVDHTLIVEYQDK